MHLNKLDESEYSGYFSRYITILDNVSLIEELEISLHEFIKFVQEIPLEKFDFRYEKSKWTIKEIIQHLIDSERIFTYRALRISRKDKTLLASFDHDLFAQNTDANSRNLQSLLTELSLVRHSTIALFKSFSDEQMIQKGIVLEQEISVRATGFLIIGHQKHHQKIYEERYLK